MYEETKLHPPIESVVKKSPHPKMYVEYCPYYTRTNRIPRELFEKLYDIIYNDGYLCYESDYGAYTVLQSIVEVLHEYKITEEKPKEPNPNRFPYEQKTIQ